MSFVMILYSLRSAYIHGLWRYACHQFNEKTTVIRLGLLQLLFSNFVTFFLHVVWRWLPYQRLWMDMHRQM